jgi:hypothetical protein
MSEHFRARLGRAGDGGALPINVGPWLDIVSPYLSSFCARHQQRDLALGWVRVIVGQ